MAGIQIPVLGGQTVRVSGVGAPQFSVNYAPTGLDQLGGTLEGLGKLAYQHAQEEAEKANETRVNEALVAGQTALDNAKLKVKQATGETAVAASQDAYGEIAKAEKGIVEGLVNDEQRRAFAKRWGAVKEDTRYQIESHVGEQTTAAGGAAMAGRSVSVKNLAANSAYSLSDPQLQVPIDMGRPIINNADGSFSTERTATFEVDGKHVVIPTIVNGKQETPEAALELWRQGKNADVGSFDTAAEADAYAKQRSAKIGEVRGPQARSAAPAAQVIEDYVADYRAWAKKRGVPQDKVDADIAEYRSDLAATVLSRLIADGATERAATYLHANSDVLGSKAVELRAQIRAKEEAAAAVGSVYAAASSTTKKDLQGRPTFLDIPAFESEVDKAIKAAGIGTPRAQAIREEADKTLRRAEYRWNKTLDEVAEVAVTKAVRAGNNLAAASAEQSWLLQSGVNGGVIWDNVRKRVEAAAHEKEGKAATPEQQSAYVDFLFDFSNPAKREEYLTMDPAAFNRRWGGELAAKDLRTAASYIAQARGGAAKPDETLPKGFEEEMLTTGGTAGAWPKNTGFAKFNDKQKARVYRVRDGLLQEQARLRSSGVQGQALVDKLREHMNTQYFVKGTVEDGGFAYFDASGVPKVRAEMDPNYADKKWTPDPVQLKPEQRSAILKSLSGAGLPTSEDWVQWFARGGDQVKDNPMPPVPGGANRTSAPTPARDNWRMER